ncbi:deoxyguanosine kinase, mitochondrial-like [Hyperolius riggenbachi]|uniref:deoxyguanosine kinase, mitochondrial-like n=1 Tax=Hyperolius riggenbachi TaxID=752182 RepID=UPI0035A3946A
MLLNKVRTFLDPSQIYRNFSKTNVKLLFRHFSKGTIDSGAVMSSNPQHKPQGHLSSSGKEVTVKRLSVEGNIAVGKSTFLRLLSSSYPGWSLMEEPLKKWQHVSSSSNQDMDNLLQLLYDNPARWSYTFQTLSCMGRFKSQVAPFSEQLLKQLEPVQIFERSVYSDKFVFAKTLHELGHFNDIEWTLYQDWHMFLLQQFGDRAALDGILYLRASPEKCFERLEKRARKEEKTVTLDYLEKLHKQHENWLAAKSPDTHFEYIRHIPVLMLDVNENFEDNPMFIKEHINKVKEFVASL